METKIVKLSQVAVNKANPRVITDGKFQKLVNSVLTLPKMLGIRPIVVDDTMTALGGNMRYRALTEIAQMKDDDLVARLSSIRDFQRKTEAERDALVAYWLQWLANPTTEVINASELSEDERREFIIKDNVGFGEWDYDMLANEWEKEDLDDWGVDVWQDDDKKKDWDESNPDVHSDSKNASLFDKFVIPPFSILDTRSGYWQERKKQWKSLIGDHGDSRKDTLFQSVEIKFKDLYTRTSEHRKKLGISFTEYLEKYVPDDVKEKELAKVTGAGVSVLDPVMAELVVRWFGLQNGAAFDCFAGDSVFGYVAAHLGQTFTGIELRPEQAELNNSRVEGMTARYINDDGQNVAQHLAPESQDLLFSCPPYFDLEVYSDLPNDASNQGSYEDFIAILRRAFTDALGCLRENRFAVIVVGDVRSKKNGCYYDFVGDIKRIFRDAGAHFYNDIVLIEPPATAAIRAERYMKSRKVAKTHQNVLVFYKGDPRVIKDTYPKIEFSKEDIEGFKQATLSDDTEGGDEAQNTNE